jgi:hypothetical protein
VLSFVKEGALRAVGHFVDKKEPITPEILRQIVLVYGNVDAHLKDLRFACMCLLCLHQRCDIMRPTNSVKRFINSTCRLFEL